MFLNFLFFLANLLIAGTVLRLLEVKFAGTAVGDAIAFAH